MIVMFAFALLKYILEVVFSVIPDIPETPQSLIDASGAGFGWLSDGVAVIMELLGRELFIAFFLLLVVTIGFEYVYIAIMWILRKIPWVAID